MRVQNAALNLFQHAARRLKEKNSQFNAIVAFNPETSNDGISVAVKDNICTTDMPTTCSSAMLEGYTSPFDATVVRLLRKTPQIHIVGKTNCDEFGMGSLNIHSSHGPVLNPFRPNEPGRSAGGSSGGSAAAVAADMCDIALGTDTGGSIRLPASYCGVVGFKPSYGMLSRWGVISYADSLDCVGVMARDVAKTKIVFEILNVHDERDPTSVTPKVRQETTAIAREVSSRWRGGENRDLTGLRIGIPQEYFPAELAPNVKDAITAIAQSLGNQGATIVPVSLPSTRYALSAYYVIASAEASSNLARYDGIRYGQRVAPPPGSDTTQASTVYSHTRSRGFGQEVQKRILLGNYSLTADAFDNYFLQALRIRQLVRNDFDSVFRAPNAISPSDRRGDVDVLIHPSAIGPAPLLNSSFSLGLDVYVQDVLTVPASLAGLPALSVPIRRQVPGDGWPLGVSIIGQWGCDDVVLKVGKAVEALEIEEYESSLAK
ncbi:amidase signature enzyme [Mycena floridula]|nr:amidase signature enzyme [Mycena floridula]